MKLPLKINLPTPPELEEQKNVRDVKEFSLTLFEDHAIYFCDYISDEVVEVKITEEESVKKWREGLKTWLNTSMMRKHMGGVEMNRMLNSWKISLYTDTGATFTFYFARHVDAWKLREILYDYIHGERKSSIDYDHQILTLS